MDIREKAHQCSPGSSSVDFPSGWKHGRDSGERKRRKKRGNHFPHLGGEEKKGTNLISRAVVIRPKSTGSYEGKRTGGSGVRTSREKGGRG